MPERIFRYRFRGSIEPTADTKRPVHVHMAADDKPTGAKKTTSATIDIFDVIDSWGGYWGISAGEVDAALTKVGKVDTLYVRVNSPGGEATEGVAIANLLRAHGSEVRVTNYGLAASAASLIAVAGDTLSMAPGSMLMIHEAKNGVYGEADDLRAMAEVLDKINASYASVYALKGGSDTDWRALMAAETWFTPDDAVTAGLADKVGIEAAPLPANVAPAAPAEPGGDDMPFDIAARMFDLSIFEHAPAAFAAHKPPAEPPEKHPTHKEAVTMTPEEIKALRERLGLADDADTATINAKLDELEEAATKPADEISDEQAAAKLGLTVEQVATAKAPVEDKGDKVTVSKVAFEELQANAKLGATARARQLEEDRDNAIKAAVATGKISRDRVKAWTEAWDADPEGVKADLGKLEARFPVKQTEGYAGSDGSDGHGAVFDDDEAGALAQLAGVSKEALLNG